MRIYNQDCVAGAQEHLPDGSVDLIISDPPFGISGDSLHKHYNRDEDNVLDGYVEAPADYYAFSVAWLREAKRVLKPHGSMYVVSGWTNLGAVLRAVEDLDLKVVNHIIWKYNFGVYTKVKYVTSHYHVLYVKLSDRARPTFNTHCRFSQDDRDGNRSLLYRDMEDVWVINREYQPGQVKNKNKLPDELVSKMILYSSNPGDVVADFFLGNFTTAFVALRHGRVPVGFEINPVSYAHNMEKMKCLSPA